MLSMARRYQACPSWFVIAKLVGLAQWLVLFLLCVANKASNPCGSAALAFSARHFFLGGHRKSDPKSRWETFPQSGERLSRYHTQEMRSEPL